ncbi:MAG: cupredoxin domain-containing protein [Frankiaceae bacterium]
MAVAVLLGGCGSSSNSSASAPPTTTAPPAGSSSAPAGQLTVTIKDFKFDPATLQATVGQTVTITNQDSAPHDWTDMGNAFKSPTLDPGQSFTYTFQKAGTYDVYCSIHPFMKQTVVVT